ncbi:hypothetical protein OnM2_043085 [Erysiphe neolycopersici]|uniref:GAG-pre-integrase domain-containing protein n=1 Tax=Erysiphe neolycopersici TaxID=212602 RepID=A0A420HV89_9PEZI|nr:hypothetical protein OnM2_043085 [Erysiphe neolycopersici]
MTSDVMKEENSMLRLPLSNGVMQKAFKQVEWENVFEVQKQCHVIQTPKFHPQIRGNYTSVFNKETCQIICKGKVIAHRRRENNLFCLDVDRVVIADQALMVSDSISSEQRCSRNELNKVTTISDRIVDVGVLHNRMGHVGHANLVRLLQNTSGFTKLSNKNNVQLQHCEDCLKGKFTNNVNKSQIFQ